MATQIKALIFDIFGTIVDWRGSIAREIDAKYDFPVNGDEFARAWRARYQPSMEPIRQGKRGYTRLDDLHRENLVDTLTRFGIVHLQDHEIDELNRVWHRLDCWADVPEGFAQLRGRYFLAPCSNGNTAMMLRLARHAGLPWDTVLGAEPARDYKPQPAVYRTAAEWLGLSPDEVLMVAAHNEDLGAARDAGLATGFFPRPNEYGDGKPANLSASSDWTIVADDLIDLARQVNKR